MPHHLLFKDRAVPFDPNEYQGQDWSVDFVAAAIAQCYDFLPDDWYVEYFSQDRRTIVVQRKAYEDGYNLQPQWIFNITADPIDEHDDNQWLVFDVYLDEAHTVYAFQIP